MWVMNVGNGLVGNDVYSFGGCDCNVRQALKERFEKPAQEALDRLRNFDSKEIQDELWRSAFELSDDLGKLYLRGLLPLEDDELLERFTGAKRILYAKALADLRINSSFRKWWGKVSVFVKIEKYTYYDKINRIPRPIQPRSMAYRAFLSKYMKVIETVMKRICLPGCSEPFLAKGENSVTLANRFIRMWERFECPVAVSLDLSKFDATIHPRLKQLENAFYKNFSIDKNFRKCLSIQESATYKPRFGRRDNRQEYGKMLHGRCSGDPQTGCGNSLIMGIVCRVVFNVPCEIFANGDDTIVITDKSNLDLVKSNLQHFSAFGLDVRVEDIAFNLEDVEWCQCRLTRTPVGWRWIRNYKKVLMTLFSNIEYTPRKVRGLCRQIAEAELAQNPGVPIVGPVCNWIVNNWGVSGKFSRQNNTLERAMMENKVYIEPTTSSRQVFADQQHIDQVEQIYWETRLIDDLKNFNKKFKNNITKTTWEKKQANLPVLLHPFSLGL